MTVVPRVLRKASGTKDPELFLLIAIAICLVSAAVAQAVGFSVALGAFLAGLSISGSEDLHEAHTTLIPLRDAFVALFFVSLGTLVVPRVILHSLPLLGVMLLYQPEPQVVIRPDSPSELPTPPLSPTQVATEPTPDRNYISLRNRILTAGIDALPPLPPDTSSSPPNAIFRPHVLPRDDFDIPGGPR